MNLKETIDQITTKLGDAKAIAPKVGIILGTGLGGLAQKIDQTGSVSYDDLPGFPASTVDSHAGQLSYGHLNGIPVVAMEGRFHFYEGYNLQEITLPVRVMKALGVETLVVSNAAGGLNPRYDSGDIVIIEDQINFMGVSPLVGPNDESLGPRFPDMIEPYSHELLRIAEESALELKLRTHRGVYIGVTGPNLETRAEYRFMRQIGADVVGMSTVPEVIVAVHCGLKVLGLSCVTDLCLPDALKPVNIDEIIAVANASEPKMCDLVVKTLSMVYS